MTSSRRCCSDIICAHHSLRFTSLEWQQGRSKRGRRNIAHTPLTFAWGADRRNRIMDQAIRSLGVRAGSPNRSDLRNKFADSIVKQRVEWRNSMARAAWKRPGSPIGKKGARKANPSYKRRSRQPWSTTDVSKLKQLAKGNTPAGVMSVKLQRPVAAIRSKAHREGISLRPVNRSPYNRRAKAAKKS
jgi:hypothetical protein